MPQSDSTTLTLLEAVDRRARVTTTGIEIVTTFYVEPATAASIVICRLLGSVSGNTLGTYARNLPAADHYLPFCYCLEAHETPFDRRSVTSCPALLLRQFGGGQVSFLSIDAALAKPIIFNGPLSLKADGTYDSSGNYANMCGAYVEAIYRPLKTVYNANVVSYSFDYIDPQMYPAARTINIGKRLCAVYAAAVFEQPVGDAGLMTETWNEFTIRRVMCPNVPWSTIQQLENRINGQQAWTPAFMTVPGLNFPGASANTFPQGTLRFDSAEPIMRTIPTCLDGNGNQLLDSQQIPITAPMSWWDITYKFSWRTMFGYWFDASGNVQGPGPIPWFCEWWNAGNTATLGALGVPSKDFYPGWYETVYPQGNSEQDIDSYRANHKYLDAESPVLPLHGHLPPGANHPFDALFMNNAP